MATTRRRNTTRRNARPRSVPIASAPLVRLPRVRNAQKRIESGYYDRNDVRDRLANAVLQVILKG